MKISEAKEKNCSGFNAERSKWENMFIQAARMEGGHAHGWVMHGVSEGLAPESNTGAQIELARQMGSVFSITQAGEIPLEKLNLEKLAAEVNVPEDRLTAVAKAMADVGVIKRTEQKRGVRFI
ncbi:MAG: hypothetical protein ACM3IJ_01610 [Candidatus Levyibacteriota bacterium]